MNRPETEAYTTHLAELVIQGYLNGYLESGSLDHLSPADGAWKAGRPLKIMDFCSGTGCISLLLYSLLSKTIPNIKICGYDISENAHKLSMENLRDAEKNLFHHTSPIEFRKIDIFAEPKDQLWIDPESKTVDIIISNPPYISHDEFYKSTARSVRNFEPKLALVPEGRSRGHDLIFFRRLLLLYEYFESSILVMEASGREQCLEIAQEAGQIVGDQHRIEIWRDWPGQDSFPHEIKELSEEDPKNTFPVRGSGSYRSVVLFRLPTVKQSQERGPA
jgi:methylase of polypeptide subunit release factors